MRFNKFFTAVLCTAILYIFALSVGGQEPANFDRPHDFDVQHYKIGVNFDRAAKKVLGDTTVTLKPTISGLKQFELDAVGFAFSSVTLELTGKPLAFAAKPNSVVVTLDRAYQPSETIAVRFIYTATPKKGVYFVDEEKEGPHKHSAQIWTQGEPDEARHWFPSFDFPSDKATTEEIITANSDETVVGNGELLGKSDAGGGKSVWHFKMPVAHSTYLVSFVIGKYVRIDDKFKDVPLGFYVYPEKEATEHLAFDDTKKMMAVFEKVTGVPFPYNKYDQTVVAQFQFGAMENITATTFSDADIFLADFEFGRSLTVDLVSHELAHSWFGDLVTCKNWAELWLNEGFATYMEAVYREESMGRDAYLTKVRSDAAQFIVNDMVTKRRHGLYNLRAGEMDKLFDVSAVTYNKGGVILHMLREQIGTENFWKGVNAYLNAHKFGSVTTPDLRKAMETASGQDLGWFFDQWVYHSGAPYLTVTPTYTASKKKLTLRVVQTQQADAIVPAVFRLPLDIEIKTAAGKIVMPVEVTKRIDSFTFDLSGRPSAVTLDPEMKVPATNTKVQKILYRK